jgi:glyoxylase-like metal-dependent hydrolase (beta-lactamase superfamily II)
MSESRVTVGNVEIVSLTDTAMEFPWPMFFPAVNMAEMEAYRSQYPDCFGSGVFRTKAGCYAIRSQGKTVLCDTGIGPGPVEFLGGIRGRLLDDMRSKGVVPADVDIVVHTHLHPDHVGWNLTPEGKPTFPKAKYYAPRADWDAFNAAIESNPHMQQVVPLKDLKALELFSGEVALTPEVSTYATPGHTPGHASIMVSSGGEKALVTGDVAHHPAQVDRTEWCSGFDMDAATTTATRRRVLDMLEADGVMTAFCHFPGSGFGRIVRQAGKRAWQAL